MSPINKILAEALRLSNKERAMIAQRLISSLEATSRLKDLQIEKAWQMEIKKRWSDIRKGKVKLIPWEEVDLDLRKHSRATG